MTQLVVAFLISWAVCSAGMLCAFGIYFFWRNPGVVDMWWPLGILMAIGVHTFFSQTNGLAVLYFGIVLVWALRLSIYLFWTRIRVGEKDARYVGLAKKWTKGEVRGFLIHFQFQAVLQAILATSAIGICYAPQLTGGLSSLGVFLLGCMISILGISLETLADYQLTQFKANPLNKGKVCEEGLWQYSRHPNLFFEWIIWIGFACMNVPGKGGWLAFFAPLFLYALMRYVTIPISEKTSLRSRGDLYASYQDKTPIFFPIKVPAKSR
jgi:steroid 5-alpha reductase family enzyme